MCEIYSLDNIGEVAKRFLKVIDERTLVALHGVMGAGKTTLVYNLCRVLGVRGNISSPTYSIIKEYEGEDQRIIYHIDLYRIKDEYEAIQAGVEDCLNSGNLCFIEWPGLVINIMPSNYLKVEIAILNETTRQLTWKVHA